MKEKKSIRGVARVLTSAKNYLIGLCSVLRRHPRIVGISVLNTVVVLIASYLLNSWIYSFGGDLKVGIWIERAKMLRAGIDHVPDSIAFVNVAYDKVLRDYKPRRDATSKTCRDHTEEVVGKQTMTDRAKLLSLFNALDSINYRYILLDVRFEKGFESDSISIALFNKINQMDRIVVARHSDGEFVDTIMLSKTALADYHTTLLEAGLVKYPTVERNGSTMADRMYHELHGGTIKKWGPIYTDNGRLCYGSIFLTYPVRITRWMPSSVEDGYPVYGAPLYDNLGSDILNSEAPIDYKERFENKIIVIGDLIEDVHETYIGTLPGSIANINTYLALARGSHLINWWWVLLLALVYTAICLSIFAHKNLFEYIPRVRDAKAPLTRFIVSLIGYSALLTLLSCIYYICAGEFYSVVMPALYFSILSAIVKYRDIKKQKP